MTEGDPEPEYPPVTATYEHAAGVRQGEEFPTTYIRFSSQPPDIVLRTINGRFSFYWSKIRRTWRGPRENWPECEAFLKSEGLEVVAGSVGDGMTRRDRQARDKKREAEGVDNGPTLAEFDWSGFPAWAEANLTIKDKKTSAFVPFKLNPLQLRLFAKMQDQWERTGWIRLNIVKSRQIGFSTFIQGFCFYIALHVPGVDALVTAHRDDAARDIFDRTKLFYERCPLKKDIHLNNIHEIKWKDPHRSGVKVSVADGVGRGGTHHLYHGSECAHYTKAGIASMGNVESSVPKAPGTMIWYETTANGKNHFYDSWQGSAAAGYENFFVGFLEDGTCRLHGVSLDDGRWANVPIEWREDEPRLRRLAREFGLDKSDTEAALCFRRQTIASKECQGLPTIFLREYPATVEDSFSATGCHRFPISIVEREWERTRAEEAEKPAPRFKLAADGEWVRDEWGLLRIWKAPEDNESYVISGDFGRGKNVAGEAGDPSKLDYTTFGVWNEHTREEVAVWHGRLDPDKAAHEMVALGRYYNTAMLVPETNHYGMITVATIRNVLKYSRLYRREKIEKPTTQPVRQDPETHWMEYGWWTGTDKSVGKENMIAWMNEAIRDATMIVREPEAWDEARSFMVASDGSMAAESGKHDDRVMRIAIAVSYMRLHPKPRRPVARPIPPPAVSADGTAFILNMKAIADKAKARRESEARKARGNWA